MSFEFDFFIFFSKALSHTEATVGAFFIEFYDHFCVSHENATIPKVVIIHESLAFKVRFFFKF